MQADTRRRVNKIITAVLSVLAAILVAFGILTALMLSDPNANTISDNIVLSRDLESKMLAAAVTGEEFTATADEVNQYLEYRKAIRSTMPVIKGAIIQRVVLSFHEDDTADAYLPVQFKGKHFGVSVHFTPSFDTEKEQIVLHVEKVKIGRLPLPPRWALGLLQDSLPDGLSVEGTDLRAAAPSRKLEYMGASAEVRVADLRIEDGKLKIKTSKNVNIPLFGLFS